MLWLENIKGEGNSKQRFKKMDNDDTQNWIFKNQWTWLIADDEGLEYVEVRARETDQGAASICTIAEGISYRLREMDQSHG